MMSDIERQDEAFDPRLSALIDHATVQLEACPDDACRRAWRVVLDGLEEMLPIGDRREVATTVATYTGEADR